jgi:glycine cleavage system H protein
MNVPANLKYTNSDEWLSIDGKIATLGVTDYAQTLLNNVIYVDIIVEKGSLLKKNDQVGTLESTKATADVKVPITGKVLEVNETLADTTELVNSDPYGKAWMIKFEIANPAELNSLMDAKAYSDYCATRGH